MPSAPRSAQMAFPQNGFTMGHMDFIADIEAAQARISAQVRNTPLERSRWLSQLSGAEVWLKLENLQHTGSFKFRGACNRIGMLSAAERARGVVTASSGNHGGASARACQALGVALTVFVPDDASPAKLDNMRAYGASIKQIPGDSVLSELAALEHARAQAMTYISPYNDDAIIAGQGTLAVEALRELGHIDAAYITVGGGGLISGAGGYLKHKAAARIIGCQPENSAVMYHSSRAGRILDIDSAPTLSDGSAGGIEPGAITFDYVQHIIDDYALVSEAAIAGAMRDMIDKHHLVVEGAAGVAVAAFAQRAQQHAGQTVLIVICGGNVSLARVREVLGV